MGKARILLVRLDDLRGISGGVMVKVVVTHSNIKVSVEDDGGSEVRHRVAELSSEKR